MQAVRLGSAGSFRQSGQARCIGWLGSQARQLVMDRVLRRSFGSSTESWNA